MHIDLTISCPVHDSFRVQQVLGMFDMPQRTTLSERFTVELPDLSDPWQIGVIVGPSGSGKTSIARQAFGASLYTGGDWPADRAAIDCFGDLPIRNIVQTLTAVGFSSPPSWIKPFSVLSNGEKFRCELARALSGTGGPPVSSGGTSAIYVGNMKKLRDSLGDKFSSVECMESDATFSSSSRSPQGSGCPTRAGSPCHGSDVTVFDEFTSVVDRTVARIGSAAVARAIRGGTIARRFVAVTCHYDVVPWLEPDWVLDMATQSLSRRRLRRPFRPLRQAQGRPVRLASLAQGRPPIRLDIRRADRSAWPIFQRHHYLSGNLHPSAQCFIGEIDNRPAVFTAVLPFPHPIRPGWREHRTVCLPDFQGVGIGSAMAAYIASLYVATGKPYFSRSSHPAVIHHRAASPLWKMRKRPGIVSRPGPRGAEKTGMRDTLSGARFTVGFEYVGKARVAEARELGIL